MNAEDEIADIRKLLIQFMQRVEALDHECKMLRRQKQHLEQELWKSLHGSKTASDQSTPRV